MKHNHSEVVEYAPRTAPPWKTILALVFVLGITIGGAVGYAHYTSYDQRIMRTEFAHKNAVAQQAKWNTEEEQARKAARGLVFARCSRRADEDRAIGTPEINCDAVADAYEKSLLAAGTVQ